eukprot:2811350-Pyramimonas_sp.AAC.2
MSVSSPTSGVRDADVNQEVDGPCGVVQPMIVAVLAGSLQPDSHRQSCYYHLFASSPQHANNSQK